MADEISLKRKTGEFFGITGEVRADSTGGMLGIDRCSARLIAGLAINVALMQRALAALFVGGDRHRSGD